MTYAPRDIATLLLALLALAGNSVLCRAALVDYGTDATLFTLVRIVSGAVMLWLIVAVQSKKTPQAHPLTLPQRLFAPLMLFSYFIGFSYAYLWLDTGIGALILFGMVQVTIATSSVIRGDAIGLPRWLGMALALIGLYFLVYTGVGDSGWSGYLLMGIAGVSWGIYTLIGRGSRDPLGDNAFNFLLCTPLIGLIALLQMVNTDTPWEWWHGGVLLALISGAITSGMGYALWFVVARKLDALSSGVAQLTVPLIAALGGVVFLNEDFSWRMWVGAGLILGGVLLAIPLTRQIHRSS